jgi:hypothetical protein
VQDQHGLTLLAYAAGINTLRANQLLDTLIGASPRNWAALITCSVGSSAADIDDVIVEDGGAAKLLHPAVHAVPASYVKGSSYCSIS